ncbi:MAG: response regulator [Lachnospiraceae bacterium]|nr:response regulator [Lachnospiraceae bacterium]
MKLLRSFAFILFLLIFAAGIPPCALASESGGAAAESAEKPEQTLKSRNEVKTGGGYAVTGQLHGVGYTAKIYDATNGLPTSDANWILGASDGYVWIGGYSGIIRYDGTTFERMDSSGGLTSGRAIFEDSKGRIWVGTNDNGVVLLDGSESTHFTYKEGLPSSSVRSFAEAPDGTVYIGSTSGISCFSPDGTLRPFMDGRLDNETIIRLSSAPDGKIYGSTYNGAAFSIENGKITRFIDGRKSGIGNITTIFADPRKADSVYIGTEGDYIYYGSFNSPAGKLEKIRVSPASDIEWITAACGRIWLCSEELSGYLDENRFFHAVTDLPMDNAIYMLTEDYQGNLWYASTRQGVMKVVANNFRNPTEVAALPEAVVNSTCLSEGLLYIGTDSGLYIIDSDGKSVQNAATEALSGTRIRCIASDKDNNLWFSTFTNSKGLVCMSPSGEITYFTEENGMLSNQVRCTTMARDGSVLAGTNMGLAIIKDGKIEKTIGESAVITNTVFLTVEEGKDGEIYAGTDGDGIYVLEGNSVRRLGRDDGLTSDVILRIKRDESRGVYWIITSNSVEYMKDGIITNVDTFPYNNNYDVYFDDKDNLWILSSYGVFVIKAEDILNNSITDYRLYSIANGLPGAVTGNSFSELDGEGNLYISCRNGVGEVNINHYFEQTSKIKTGIRSILCNDEEILPDPDGVYIIPATKGRIQITPAILDFTMTNPTVHVFLEGSDDSGITAAQSNLTPLEYTGLGYGNYQLHIQVLDGSTGEVFQDDIFPIIKKPRLMELLVVRIILIALIAAAAGLIVWRVMTGTIIRRQYEEIRAAKEEAERANSAKSRFLANMSHEIRTPINTIMGMDEMILREDAENVPKNYFMSVINYALDIRTASESLLGLINDLLDMSKIESGKMHLVEQEYDVKELFRSVSTMIRVRSAEKDLTFDIDIDETLPVRLYGDAGKIKQVTLNLLTNAVKYTEKGGLALKVKVTGKTEERCDLRIAVSDTGIGVKPEDMEKLFTAYERLDEEKNSGIQGTGLGLDISRRFSELMDGKLWCESVYGEGSEFIFTFSQKIIDPEGIGKFDPAEDRETKGPYVPQFIAPDAHILVVDDNQMNLNVIKGLLKSTKVSVTTASSGEECLVKLKDASFNVVLLDHMMPGMDGIETLEKIRESDTSTPVYALTANSTAGGDDFYKQKGFNGYLAKPVDSRALETAIMQHIPEELITIPSPGDFDITPENFPEELSWIKEVKDISVEEGVKNSGGISGFGFSLNLFLDTIDDNSALLENALKDGDIRLYTVKVHALKSSARIIGAMELSKLCEELEEAGNKGNEDFIRDNNDRMLSDYRSFKEKLKPLREASGEDERETVPAEVLSDAYEALKESIPQMDYDSVEMILKELKEYRLPDQDREKLSHAEKLLKALDWDGLEEMFS